MMTTTSMGTALVAVLAIYLAAWLALFAAALYLVPAWGSAVVLLTGAVGAPVLVYRLLPRGHR